MQGMPGHQGMMREHGDMSNTPGAKAMMDSMRKMQQGMMGHMMEHMQAGTGSMAMCPMMKQMGGMKRE